MTKRPLHSSETGSVVALCGGVGGAKLALGLYRLLAARLTVVVNTGDDFEHLGLRISPDLDTVLYTLASVNDLQKGWGRRDETWNFLDALREIGEEDWFLLGDKDLALHVARTSGMAEGKTLAEVTRHFCDRFGVDCNVIPMSNNDVRTVVDTPGGSLSFQHYFVKYRCEPEAKNIRYVGAAEAGPIFLDRLSGPDLRAVIICPSNPYLSIGPILALPGVRAALANASAPVVAVSPIIGGSAVKGPTAKIMAELGVGATSASIADFYTGVIDGLIVDQADALDVADLAVECHTAETLMTSIDDRIRLAGETVEFADRLRNGKIRRFATSEIRHVTP